MTMIDNHLIADDGMYLVKDDIVATEVYLGIRDSADEWQEVEIEQIEENERTEMLRFGLKEFE